MSASDPCEHLELAPTPTAARRARSFLAEQLPDLSTEVAEAARLCTSELVTNGVLHARTPLLLGVTRGADRILVTVGDKAPGQPQRKPPDDNRPSGRGIVLVDVLAAQWGVHDDGVGKTVWFTVARGASSRGAS